VEIINSKQNPNKNKKKSFTTILQVSSWKLHNTKSCGRFLEIPNRVSFLFL